MSKKTSKPTPAVKVPPSPAATTTAATMENANDTHLTGFLPLGADAPSWMHAITKGFIPYLLIAIIGIAVYANTFNHEYALDDDIVICKNEYVMQGLAGIPKIMTSDVFESFYTQMNTTAQLSGGRYRPFAIATYAIEQEFLGTMPKDGALPKAWDLDKDGKISAAERVTGFLNSRADINKNGKNDPDEDINGDGLFNDKDSKIRGMGFRHVNNVILYAFSVCMIYLFLSSFFFKNNKWFALLVSLLFLVHPVHTEVVGNVKSRDEILSLLFIVLTLHKSFRYMETLQNKHLIWACIAYFFAMMSKEYGFILVPLLAISYYFYFPNRKLTDYVKPLFSLGAVFIFYYVVVRMGIAGIMAGKSDLQDTELLNNPYLLAEADQIKPTQMFMHIKYFFLMLFPTTLSCDYSYNVIPYKNWANPGVFASLILVVGGIYALLRTSLRKSWLAFAIGFTLLPMFLVDNLVFNIGATMGERLVYHSSLGFMMLLLWAVYELAKKLKVAPMMAVTVVGLLFAGYYAFKTIERNPAWKNDITLHLTDVKTMPESTMLNGNACTRLIELAEMPKNASISKRLLDSAKIYGYKSLQLHDRFVNSYLNMGIIYAKQNNIDSAAVFWNKVEQFYPNHPQLLLIKQNLSTNFMNKAMEYVQKKDFPNAMIELKKAYAKNPKDINLLNNLGGVSYNMGDFVSAKDYWNQALAISPSDTNVLRGINALKSIGKY